MREMVTTSPDETYNEGKKLGSLLNKGDRVYLTGDMGSGKTAFTKGIAAGLGIEGHITSPTFTLVNEYEGEIPLYHFDVYRISDPEEMLEIGFEEYLEVNGVVVIEWAELIQGLLPTDGIWIDIRKGALDGRDSRTIRMEFKGDRYKKVEALLNKEERNHRT